MRKTGDKSYPEVVGLEDIVQETRAWYRALGLNLGGSLYSVIKASSGISGLLSSIVESLGLQSDYYIASNKDVKCVVEDVPSIAFVTNDSRGILVHIGSWLYNREKLEEWLPAVQGMSESDVLALSLGLINGAVALDMLAKSTGNARVDTIKCILRNVYFETAGQNERVYTFVVEREPVPENLYPDWVQKLDESVLSLAAAIHDVLCIKAVLNDGRKQVGWAIFPILLFRTVFDDRLVEPVKKAIEEEDTLDNLLLAVYALRNFSTESAKLLEVTSSVGINVIKALLANGNMRYLDWTYAKERGDGYEAVKDAVDGISSDIVNAYREEIKEKRDEGGGEDRGKDEDKRGSEKQENYKGKQKKNDGKRDGKDKINKNAEGQSAVRDIAPHDPSTPINEDIKKQGEKLSSDEQPRDTNKSVFEPSEEDKRERSRTEKYMRLIYKPGDPLEKVRKLNKKAHVFYFDSVAAFTAKDGRSDYRQKDELKEELEYIDRNIAKRSLRNLFLARTMDIEKSQPARSGVSIIPTRIANIFTDEKIFTPLPDEITERDSEIILLVDGSGSMVHSTVRVYDKARVGRKFMTLLSGVTGVAKVLQDTFERSSVRCSTFLHTTSGSIGGSEECIVVIKLCDDETYNKEKSFLESAFIYPQNNGDGYALEETAKHFTTPDGLAGKTIIVLSDGEPACRAYGRYSDGVEHTKNMAKKLREEGIQVYSISLTESVVESNDEIYGKENNLHASFPENKGASSNAVNVDALLDDIVKIISKQSTRSANNVLTQG